MAALLALPGLNQMSILAGGRGWPFTLALALCCAFLCLTVRVPARRALGAPGFLIVATLVSYLIIGIIVLLLADEGLRSSNYTMPLRVGLAILLIVATAIGASAMLQRIEVESLLRGVLVVLAAACIIILLTPWLQRYYIISNSRLPTIWASTLEGRFTGSFVNPNYASAIASYAVAISLSLLYGGRYRTLAGPVALLGSVAAFLTFSRTGIVALALVFIFFLGLSMSHFLFRKVFSGWVLAAIVLIAGAFVLAIANLDYLSEHFIFDTGRRKRVNLGDSVVDFYGQRLALWSNGLSQIAESPLFGHGITLFHSLKNADGCKMSEACGVHNAYLMLWGEAGILPPTLLLLFIGSLLWRWWMLPRSVAANAGASCVLVIATWCLTQDDTPYYIGSGFMIGLVCAVMAHAARESRGPRPARTLQPSSASIRTEAGGITPSGAG